MSAPPSIPVVTEPPAPGPPRRRLPLLLRPPWAVATAVRRRPGRSLAIGLLLGLIALGFTMAGSQLWAGYHFRAARGALEHYHTQEAADHLRACLAAWPNDPDTLFLAARAARRNGLFEDAEDFLDHCQRRRGGRDDALTLERALLTAERGDVDDVLKFCLARVEANDPAAPLILEALIRGFLRRFRNLEAEDALKVWEQRDPENPMMILLRGRVAQDRQADTDAAADFRRVLELDPELDEARDRLAKILLDTHQASEAQLHLEYLHGRRPEELGITVRLAQCRDLLGQQDEAVQFLDGVLARRPDYIPALAERGKLALRAGERVEAEMWLRKALALAPGDATLLRPLHLCLEQTGQDQEARALETRLKKAEDDLTRMGTLMSEDIRRNPRDADLWYEGGMIWLRAGSVAEGVRWLENAVRFNPRHVKAHEALADVYQRTGQGVKATRHEKLAREASGAE